MVTSLMSRPVSVSDAVTLMPSASESASAPPSAWLICASRLASRSALGGGGGAICTATAEEPPPVPPTVRPLSVSTRAGVPSSSSGGS